MPLEQTITVINNSGKIISSGKQLLSIFKEAKASYDDKKAEIKAERQTLNRAQTFDLSRSHSYRNRANDPYQHHHQPHHHSHLHHYYLDEPEHYYDEPEIYDRSRPPVSKHGRHFDEYSEASSRRTAKPRRSRSVGGRSNYSQSQVSSSTHNRDYPSSRELRRGRSKPALTENNLKTFSEVSSEAPSRAPAAYRSPYAETIPLDAVMSKMDITHAELRHYAQTRSGGSVTPPERRGGTRSAALSRRQSVESGFSQYSDRAPGKEIDMDLAYGNVPPDLEDRFDLDPAYQEAKREERAQALVRKVEGLLDEAHCVQHGATAVISNLQKSPETAASVALTLAELSTAVGKMSPAFLGMLKGGSPLVFSLLASPQFLIGTGIAMGVTVVMFGGWKIVKKVKEQNSAREAIAFAADGPYYPSDRPLPMRTQTQSEFSAGMDEALELDDEVSTIETWRRGIMPYGADNESADYELITPEARRANRERHGHRGISDEVDDADTKSRRSAKTSSGEKKKKTSAPSVSGSRSGKKDVSDKKSRKAPSSVAGSSSGKKSGKSRMKAIDDGTRSRIADEEAQSMIRPRDREPNMLKAVFKRSNKSRSEVMIV